MDLYEPVSISLKLSYAELSESLCAFGTFSSASFTWTGGIRRFFIPCRCFDLTADEFSCIRVTVTVEDDDGIGRRDIIDDVELCMAGVSATDMHVSSDVQLFPLSNHCRVISMSNLIVLFSIKHFELSLNTTNNPIYGKHTKYTEKIEQKQEQKWKENQKTKKPQ